MSVCALVGAVLGTANFFSLEAIGMCFKNYTDGQEVGCCQMDKDACMCGLRHTCAGGKEAHPMPIALGHCSSLLAEDAPQVLVMLAYCYLMVQGGAAQYIGAAVWVSLVVSAVSIVYKLRETFKYFGLCWCGKPIILESVCWTVCACGCAACRRGLGEGCRGAAAEDVGGREPQHAEATTQINPAFDANAACDAAIDVKTRHPEDSDAGGDVVPVRRGAKANAPGHSGGVPVITAQPGGGVHEVQTGMYTGPEGKMARRLNHAQQDWSARPRRNQQRISSEAVGNGAAAHLGADTSGPGGDASNAASDAASTPKGGARVAGKTPNDAGMASAVIGHADVVAVGAPGAGTTKPARCPVCSSKTVFCICHATSDQSRRRTISKNNRDIVSIAMGAMGADAPEQIYQSRAAGVPAPGWVFEVTRQKAEAVLRAPGRQQPGTFLVRLSNAVQGTDLPNGLVWFERIGLESSDRRRSKSGPLTAEWCGCGLVGGSAMLQWVRLNEDPGGVTGTVHAHFLFLAATREHS